MDVSLEIELSTESILTIEQERAKMESNGTKMSRVLKSVKNGVVAFLGYLVGRFYFERVTELKSRTVICPRARQGGSIPPAPPVFYLSQLVGEDLGECYSTSIPNAFQQTDL